MLKKLKKKLMLKWTDELIVCLEKEVLRDSARRISAVNKAERQFFKGKGFRDVSKIKQLKHFQWLLEDLH